MTQTLKDKLQKDFCDYYKFINRINYNWSNKDNTHLGQLIGKLRQQQTGLSTEQMRDFAREYFKFCFREAPEWYRDNCEVSIINTKFNILYKLWKRPDYDPAEYDKINRVKNYRNGNKKRNPAHNCEPADLGHFINKFIAENSE